MSVSGEGLDIPERLRGVLSALDQWGRRTLRIASRLIGKEASENYMRDAGAGAGRRSRVDQGPLRIVSGRLAKSLVQSAERNADAIEEIAQVGATRFQLRKGSRVEYAAIHEYGGETRPRVTDKMRRFAWAKYYETGIDTFKGIALTKKNRLSVSIPARPYLRPGTRDALPRIEDRARETLNETLQPFL